MADAEASSYNCNHHCGQWCGAPTPKPPHPPPHNVSAYFLLAPGDNLCYQTNYTDLHYRQLGYQDGFCPFQVIDDTLVTTICDHHSEENTKYCPNSQINITVYKMGKA